MIIPRDYQAEQAEIGAELLRKYMILYLSWEERTGKSLTSLLVAELVNVSDILIITKKKALGSIKEEDGWLWLLHEYFTDKKITVTTYGKAVDGPHDLVILDEAHNYISGYPKPSATWKKLRSVCRGRPIIYLSATPHAQGYQLLYHQFALSTWSPWANYSTFYNWHRAYGIPYTIKVHDKDVNQYDRVQDNVIEACIDHLFISKTRKELGFDHEPKDKIHYIELSDDTKKLYNKSMKDKILPLGKTYKMLDTTITMRTSLHMLEGGIAKLTSNIEPKDNDDVLQIDKERFKGATLYHTHYNITAIDEKIQYILDNWGDATNIAIMYNYIGEGVKLHLYFKHAKILQATSNAEGIELSHVEHLIIYSQDFSTARHTQRRARQASKQREWPIMVHFLLVKNAISDQVYKTVSINKVNYVDSRFEKVKI